jgi:Tol biopolymer transport system component
MVTYLDHDALQGLWVADLLGGRIRIYSGYAHMPEWSPQGDKIAFTSGGIWTINIDGTRAKRVVPNTSAWSYHHAKWSPDGNYLVFTGNPPPEDSSADLFRATASGGNLLRLTSTPAPFRETTYEFHGGWR